MGCAERTIQNGRPQNQQKNHGRILGGGSQHDTKDFRELFSSCIEIPSPEYKKVLFYNSFEQAINSSVYYKTILTK